MTNKYESWQLLLFIGMIVGIFFGILQLSSGTPIVIIESRPVSNDFPWHMASQKTHQTVEASAPSENVVNASSLEQIHSDVADMPISIRQQALENMRKAHFSEAWSYVNARHLCLSGSVFSSEQGCEMTDDMAQDDAQALMLLQSAADRSIPEAEMALAQWWISDFSRKIPGLGGWELGVPASAETISTDKAQRRLDAQLAQRKALDALTSAAPHNPAAAVRLEELKAAWGY